MENTWLFWAIICGIIVWAGTVCTFYYLGVHEGRLQEREERQMQRRALHLQTISEKNGRRTWR